MTRVSKLALLFLLHVGLIPIFANASDYSALDTTQQKVKEIIKNKVDTLPMPDNVSIGRENLVSPEMTWEYYIKNDYLPVWLKNDGVSPLADTLISIIRMANRDGLEPEYYHYSFIQTCLKDSVRLWINKKNYTSLVNLELLLTDAFLSYVANEYAGVIHDEVDNVEWEKHIANISPVDSLQKIDSTGNLRIVLEHFYCKHPTYLALKKALVDYANIQKAGGWPVFPADTYLKKGDTGKLVKLLYKRLLLSGDISKDSISKNDSVFNYTLENGVKQFQARYGIHADDVVDKSVVKGLNVSVDERIKQIEMNMERWRWLPHELKQPYIMVNIAGFELNLVDSNRSVLNMKIIVGKTYTRTPLFHARMTYLILNPWWEIPMKIARKEIVPLIKKDTSYLSKNDIKVYNDWSKDAREIPADSIKWDSIAAARFPYRLRQAPGVKNALGRIKFMFPNKYDVYLHDTPERHLFDKTVRAFSHGCIRIEKPLELATYLLQDDPNWTRDSIITAIDSNVEQNIILPKAVDVYICYWTSWIDENGELCFRPDIYENDKRLEELTSKDPVTKE